MLVSGWVLLGLEQRVEVPERAFYEVVSWHLCEAAQKQKLTPCVFFKKGTCVRGFFHHYSPHLQEDLPELCSNLHQRVQVATVWGHTHSFKVIGLEFLLFPVPTMTRQEQRSC